MFKAILGFLGGPITKWLEIRAIKKAAEAEQMLELARAETAVRIAKAEASAEIERKKATADIDWEKIWATQAAKSWKDEYWTIALSVPMFMAFIPGLDDDALHGFEVIDQMPEWYVMALLAAIGAAFGLRALAKFKVK